MTYVFGVFLNGIPNNVINFRCPIRVKNIGKFIPTFNIDAIKSVRYLELMYFK